MHLTLDVYTHTRLVDTGDKYDTTIEESSSNAVIYARGFDKEPHKYNERGTAWGKATYLFSLLHHYLSLYSSLRMCTQRVCSQLLHW